MGSFVAICTDLFFAVKIDDAARRLGGKVRFARSAAEAVEAAEAGARVAVIDLSCRDVDPLEAAKALRAVPGLRIVGFVPHVQIELRREAEAICDRVVARSVFVEKLDELLAG